MTEARKRSSNSSATGRYGPTRRHFKVQGFAVGGVDYVTKPFAVEEVLARVAAHTELHMMRQELEQKNRDLAAALAEVKRLSGLLPICAGCKKIRDDL